ncbi:unnamed protein product [Kluyveromyces dobzhanskii CBS 2104]|uniref:WGS project CCBQ000000000 data, contig 00058 n=1 Tax=Kluyveromyces dobzhanskii CBS 2104 TaxID=1427455 RepID=A0A0A8LDX9_9SACH|nr:unnamed protein product [Kluyveromyces dobzhanskii CBS 2104]
MIELCIPSPRSGLVACITNHANVLLYENNKALCQVDNTKAPFLNRAYHSIAWDDKGQQLFTGNEMNTIDVFMVTSEMLVTHNKSFILDLEDQREEKWVTTLRYQNDMMTCSNNENEVYLVDLKSSAVKRISGASKFAISDIQFVGNRVLFTKLGSVHCYDISADSLTVRTLDVLNEFFIIALPNKDSAILLSDRTSVKVELKRSEILFLSDEVISPVLEKKFTKWNNRFNEYHKYETKLYVRGLAPSPDGFSIAILYDIERISLKYSIPSEQVFRLLIVPLADEWEVSHKASGLAWYQTYNIYDHQRPKNIVNSSTENNFDTSQSFDDYLSSMLQSKEIMQWRLSNFIEDQPSATRIHTLIYSYVSTHLEEITNPLDKAYVIWLSLILGKVPPFELGVVQFKGQFISEQFDFNKHADASAIISESNHEWKRCCVTGLPLISTGAKVCPVSSCRVIDIEKDNLNDYGWLSTTVLKTFGNISIFTGTNMSNV